MGVAVNGEEERRGEREKGRKHEGVWWEAEENGKVLQDEMYRLWWKEVGKIMKRERVVFSSSFPSTPIFCVYRFLPFLFPPYFLTFVSTRFFFFFSFSLLPFLSFVLCIILLLCVLSLFCVAVCLFVLSFNISVFIVLKLLAYFCCLCLFFLRLFMSLLLF